MTQQQVDGKDLKAIEDFIYSTMNHTPEWEKAEQAYQNILRSRPAPQQQNLSCLGQYDRDPCLMPACPIKVMCREYTELRKQPPAPQQPEHFILDAGLRAEIAETLLMAGCPCLSKRVLEETMPDYQMENHELIRRCAMEAQPPTPAALLDDIEKAIMERARLAGSAGLSDAVVAYADAINIMKAAFRAKEQQK